jgi:oxalate decarboxylase/phosphoglucose isomerase-like protein (cupin superfamily)
MRSLLNGLVLFSALVNGCGLGADRGAASPQDPAHYGRPTVFARGQGEQRMMRGSRPLFIVADSTTVGSRTLVAGYEEVPPGDSGRTHMHLEEDELLFVHRGELEILLGDYTYRAAAGASVFVPRRTWIRFRTVGPDTAGFLFVFNAPAFEKCLRALSAPRGERYVPLAEEEMQRIDKECHRVAKAQVG